MSVKLTPSTVEQRPKERVAYTIDTADYGGAPTGVAVTLYASVAGTWTDVSGTKLSGSASVAGDVITTPLVILLEAGASYILEVLFVAGGNTWAPIVTIKGVK